MLVALISVAISLASMGLGKLAVGRWIGEYDPAARLGVGGLVGMGVLGMVTFLVGLIPGGFNILLPVVGVLCLVGLYAIRPTPEHEKPSISVPKGLLVLFPVVIGLALMLAWTGVVSPSTTTDWDSLAYHLAVPKMWIAQGNITFISFIHHSNFPAVVDSLFVIGLKLGDQAAAKAFTWMFTFYGCFALFGLARRRYGDLAGWFAALTFVTVPMVIWESGSAYIDVAHGLFAGLGLWLVVMGVSSERKGDLYTAAVLLGFAAGSKYTGLQSIGVAVIVAGVGSIRQGFGAASSAKLAVLIPSALIAAPFYLKNILLTGNPVYPFFFSVFGGKNWDQFAADIYTREQKTFGIGASPKLDVTAVGESILSLAYQPGRFTNPFPTQNTGFIFVSIGAVGLATALAWAIGGKTTKVERLALLAIGISLLLWFGLSQQSRYILSLLPLFAILLGGLVSDVRVPVLSKAMGGLAVAQAGLGIYILVQAVVPPRLAVLSGGLTPAEYLGGYNDASGQPVPGQVGFYRPAQRLNEVAKGGKVALFDEVFGFFLDVPYMWANPGHTTELGYAQMNTADDFVASLKRMGITHVYMNLSIYPRDDATTMAWTAAMGIGADPVPFAADQRKIMMDDLGSRWKVLLAEAIATKKIVITDTFGRRLIGEIAK